MVLGLVPARAQASNDEEVKAFIEDFIHWRNESMADLEVKDQIMDYFHEDNFLDPLALEGQIGIYLARPADARLSDYDSRLTFNEIRYEDGLIWVSVEEEMNMYYKFDKNSPAYFCLENKFLLSQEDDGLKVLSVDHASWLKGDLIFQLTGQGPDQYQYMNPDIIASLDKADKDQAQAYVDDMIADEMAYYLENFADYAGEEMMVDHGPWPQEEPQLLSLREYAMARLARPRPGPISFLLPD